MISSIGKDHFKDLLQPHGKGPYQVLLTTSYAENIQGVNSNSSWEYIHVDFGKAEWYSSLAALSNKKHKRTKTLTHIYIIVGICMYLDIFWETRNLVYPLDDKYDVEKTFLTSDPFVTMFFVIPACLPKPPILLEPCL